MVVACVIGCVVWGVCTWWWLWVIGIMVVRLIVGGVMGCVVCVCVVLSSIAWVMSVVSVGCWVFVSGYVNMCVVVVVVGVSHMWYSVCVVGSRLGSGVCGS